MISIDRRFMLDTALHATHASINRHERGRIAGDLREVFIGLAEAVYWAATLDAAMWDGGPYDAERKADWNGRAIPGVIYARNLQTHHLPMTVEVADLYSDTYLPFYGDYAWVQFDRLPPPDKPSKYTAEQQESYRTRLAGHPTSETMKQIRSWFAHVQLQPWSRIQTPTWADLDAAAMHEPDA